LETPIVNAKPRILALLGSSCGESLIGSLLRAGAEGAAAAGAEVTTVNLGELPLPIFDSDWEAEHGVPENARTLRTFISENHALLIATPEHNGGYSALLKNAIDWACCIDGLDEGQEPLFSGRAAALICASTEPLGGLGSRITLQLTLSAMGVLVIPTRFAASPHSDAARADSATNEARRVGAMLADVTSRLVPGGTAAWR
jgi:chromate reductase